MPPISEAALEACRHQGYTQTPTQEAVNAWLSPNGYIIDEADLPRPDEDHGDCLRYLEFVLLRDEWDVSFMEAYPDLASVEMRRITSGTTGGIHQATTLPAAITAACNAAMRTLAESEGEA